MEDERITVTEAARRLGLKPRRVQMLIADGELKAERFGNAYMLKASDLASVVRRPVGRPKASNKPVK